MTLASDVRAVARRARREIRGRFDRIAVDRVMAEREPLRPEEFRAALYFADGPVNLYQIRQWYRPFRELAGAVPTLVIAHDVTTTRILLEECPLPVLCAATMADIERWTADSPLDAVFYVNQNNENFSMIRLREPAHVFLSHGESDKDYMASNQLKAYDFTFIAGGAARNRLRRTLIGYDVDRRTIEIGRPQIDDPDPGPALPDDGRTTVLYAPTWEGDRPSMTYSSLVTHGPRLVSRLARDRAYRVIYRPHPRTGTEDESFKLAHRAMSAALESANRSDRSARHRIDTGAAFGWQLGASDVCISDVSAVAFDWLTTGKPLLLTVPESADARLGPDNLVHHVPTLAPGEVDGIADRIRVARDFAGSAAGRQLARRYFGDTAPGAATRRFIAAAHAVVDGRAAERANRASAGR